MKQSNKKGSRFPVFQERLRQVQGELSNTDFAKKLGMSRQTIGFYLNGDRLPDILALRTIAEVCDVTADWLIGLTDTPERTPAAVDELGLSPGAVEAIRRCTRERFLQTNAYFSMCQSVHGKDVEDTLVDAVSPIHILNSALENQDFWRYLYDIGYYTIMISCCKSTREDFKQTRELARELRKYNMTTVSIEWRAKNGLSRIREWIGTAFVQYCRSLTHRNHELEGPFWPASKE